MSESDIVHFRRQFRRRRITSMMIGVIGLVVITADWVNSPLMMAFYLIGLLLMVGWILMQATLDLLQSQTYARESRKRRLTQRGEMEAEVERLRKEYQEQKNDEE